MQTIAVRSSRRVSLLLSLGALALLCAASAARAQAPEAAPDYTHLKMQVDKLAGDVYFIAGINPPGRSGGNLVFLAGPDGILMVDTDYPALADKTYAAVRTVSNAPIRFVVNTHSHGEFTGGDPYFAKMGATVITRPEVRDALAAQKGFDHAGLPTITYTTPLTLHLDGEDVELIPVPPSHTFSDSMIYFHHADVLVTGDFFRAGYPNIGGTVDGMIATLGLAAGACGPNTKVVPGHGPVMNRDDIFAQRDMLAVVRDRVAKLIAQGKSEEEVIAAHPTADYDAKYLSVLQYYDGANLQRFGSPDAFLKQVYAGLKPKTKS